MDLTHAWSKSTVSVSENLPNTLLHYAHCCLYSLAKQIRSETHLGRGK